LNNRIFKENFEFENYFRILEDKDMHTLCKFRTTNHKLPIETGRWNNIDRVNRICTKCRNIWSSTIKTERANAVILFSPHISLNIELLFLTMA
jgi:hypothetical protein